MADQTKKQPTGGRKTDGKEGTAISVGLKEPAVELVDLASTSRGQGLMQRPVAPVRKLRRMRAHECSDDGDESDSSIISTASAASLTSSRKRGRPPTTGEYVGLAEAKQRLLDLSLQQEAIETEGRILDPSFQIDVADKNMRPDEEIAAELRTETLSSLAAIVGEEMQLVRKTAKMSSNLKGTVQRALKDSAQRTRLAAVEMAKRQGDGGGRAAALEAENRKLRAEVETLRDEVRSLSAQVERLLGARVSSMEIDSHGREGSLEVSENPRDTPPATAVAANPSAHSQCPTEGSNEELKENRLLERIAELVDRKLAVFYLEAFPEKAARPPLGKKEDQNRAPQQQCDPVESLPKKKKKKGKGIVEKTPPTDHPSNNLVQAAPTTKPSETAWSEVVGRKAARKATKKGAPAEAKKVAQQGKKEKSPAKTTVEQGSSKAVAKPIRPPRAPKTAAVTLTMPEGTTFSYADAMKSVRQKVSLTDLGIGEVRPKRALTGGLILEIPGPEGAAKAKALASRMADALAGTGAKVAQPTKMAELRVRGLDDSVTPDEVAAAMAGVGGCTVGEIKIGEIRRSPTGLGTVWARCPAAAARKVVISGRLTVGWVAAKVDALEARPLQCHRCLEMGHVRQRCTATIDRSALCYNCGAPGHRAGQCPAKSPHCPLCADAGKPADHRMGSKKCSPSRKSKGQSEGKQGPTAVPSASGDKPPTVKKTPAKPAGKPAQGCSGLEEAMETN